MTRRGAKKGTKGASCVSWLSCLFVGFVFQSPPQHLAYLPAQPPLTHFKITLIVWSANDLDVLDEAQTE